jgi:hypothetical protein
VGFPVFLTDGTVVSCVNLSEVLRQVPVVSVEFLFIAPEHKTEAKKHLEKHKAEIIKLPSEAAE